jgi:hypothetical protein
MKHMIVGAVVTIVTIIIFIIGFTVLDEPIQLITDTFADAYPEGGIWQGHDTVEDQQGALIYFFWAAIATGIILALVWFAAWGHKSEYERYQDERYKKY